MTLYCLPIDVDPNTALPYFEDYQSRVAFAALMSARVDRPLGALSGFRAGSEPLATVDASSVTFSPFVATIDAGTDDDIGPYLVGSTEPISVNFDEPDTHSERYDRFDVQVPDKDPGTFGRKPKITYTAGLAGGGSPPAAPDRSLEIGVLDVPVDGTAVFTPSGLVTVASGGIVPVSGQQPAHPYVGQHTYDTSTGRDKVWDGTEWADPDVGGLLRTGAARVTVWFGTQAQYSAITSPDPNTLYVVTED